jgi:hypothetical protein
MINYQNVIGNLNRLKDELFTASLPDESQIAADAIKAINGLMLQVERERSIALGLSKIVSTLIVDVERVAEANLESSKQIRDVATKLTERAKDANAKVVSLHDTKEGS